jgi:integrase
VFYRKVWIPGVGYDVASLGTTDRDEAEQYGKELLAELLRGTPSQRDSTVTLGELWERYRREAPSYLDSTETTKKDARSRVNILLGHFGEQCDVTTLTEHDIKVYTKKRLAGGITSKSGHETKQVRPRSAEADLVLLHSMLRWATTVRTSDGKRWLKENPLHGVRKIREQNPVRPVATWDRFIKTREAMQELASKAKSDDQRSRWIKLELALVLAEATGRRLNSIRQLRWDDIDFERHTIRWRAEADKKRRESVVPLPQDLVDELKAFRKRLGAFGGWIFGRTSDGDQPMDRHLFDKWLVVAEKRAKLPKLKGGLWHPYRRKWATERKNLSLKDVAAAGGWKDIETLLRCYQQPDDDSLLAVMSEKRKLRERAAHG